MTGTLPSNASSILSYDEKTALGENTIFALACIKLQSSLF